MRQGAQGSCTGMTLRDGMGREVGGRVRMVNTCTPIADPLIKISGKKTKSPIIEQLLCLI